MSNCPENYVFEVLAKIAAHCELKEWSCIQKKFDSIAQNYFGVLIPVILKGKQEGIHKSFDLVLKLAPPNEMYRVSGAVTIFFAREVFVYSQLLCKYGELQAKLSSEYQYVIPRCYYVCDEYCKEVIAMQNMCVDGYLPYTKLQFLDLNHIRIALKSLAKFHALSFILKEKDQILYDKAKNICVALTSESNSRFFAILTDRLTKALLKFENTTYALLLENLKTNCNFFIESAIYRAKNVCLSHGDIWKENILFKYMDNMPISACIIDYQTTRMSTPAFDVLFLLMTSTDTGLRQKHFNNLIDTYYDTFRQYLLSSSLEPRNFYPKEDFEYDLNMIGPACFIVANTAMWLASGLQAEGHVKSKYQPVTEEDKLEAVNRYKTIIKGIIDDLNIYGYMKMTELVNK